MNNERLFLFVARFVDDGYAAVLLERRTGLHLSYCQPLLTVTLAGVQ
jgi:hypothetical protein